MGAAVDMILDDAKHDKVADEHDNGDDEGNEGGNGGQEGAKDSRTAREEEGDE